MLRAWWLASSSVSRVWWLALSELCDWSFELTLPVPGRSAEFCAVELGGPGPVVEGAIGRGGVAALDWSYQELAFDKPKGYVFGRCVASLFCGEQLAGWQRRVSGGVVIVCGEQLAGWQRRV